MHYPHDSGSPASLVQYDETEWDFVNRITGFRSGALPIVVAMSTGDEAGSVGGRIGSRAGAYRSVQYRETDFSFAHRAWRSSYEMAQMGL